MKTKLVILLILACAIAAAYFVLRVPPCDFKLTVGHVEENSSEFNIFAEYPQFSCADKAFNKKIADYVTGAISDFKNDSRANQEARQATAPKGQNVAGIQFDFRGSWQPSQLNSGYVSFTETLYYFSGGAHGIDELVSYNYDVSKQKEIGILDMAGNLDNLKKLSDIAKQNIKAILESRGVQLNSDTNRMVEDGAAPTEENYKNFTFGPDALTINFEKYQVAPGVAGSFSVPIYKDTLDTLGIKNKYF